MWWNILPSWIITGGCVYAPAVLCGGMAYFYMGSPQGRDMNSQYHFYHIFRDKRILDGAQPMRQIAHLGLDGIPDD